MTTLNVDRVIKRLLAVRDKSNGANSDLEEWEIKALAQNAREIFLKQPILLELRAPLKICGDIESVVF